MTLTPWASGDVHCDRGSVSTGLPGFASSLTARSASGAKSALPVPGADPQGHDRGIGPQGAIDLGLVPPLESGQNIVIQA